MDKDFYLSHIHKNIANSKVRISQLTIEKVKNVLKLLDTHKINREQLQTYCFQGIPDECNGLRSLCWKILLGYLPDRPAKWGDLLDTHRQNYQNFLSEYFLPRQGLTTKKTTVNKTEPLSVKTLNSTNTLGGEGESNVNNRINVKNPKIIKKSWAHIDNEKDSTEGSSLPRPKFLKTGYDENTLWDEITKDTRRTRAGMHFFQEETNFPLDKIHNKENTETHKKETHSDVLSRILFIYGRLNPGVAYVQGMNEVLAPIYYCFCNDQNPAFLGHAEADSFYCFSILMGELQDSFVRSFDHAGVGIQARITTLNRLLKKIDPTLWTHLNKCHVDPQFYTLRWLMLLLTQEFPLVEVLRLWDTLLSHPKKLEYLNFICIAMIETVKDKLFSTNEFANLMEILQRGTTEDLERIISTAFKIYKEYVQSS